MCPLSNAVCSATIATLFDRDARARATTQPTSATVDACRMTRGDGDPGMAATWAAVQRASAELLDAARRHAARDDAPPELVALLEQERLAFRAHLLALARRHRSP